MFFFLTYVSFLDFNSGPFHHYERDSDGISFFKGTPPETNSSHLKMDGWNTTFLLGRPIFRCYVSSRRVKIFILDVEKPKSPIPHELLS